MVAIARKAEYGDFQTPPELAAAVCRVLVGMGVRAKRLLEPTCGVGGFLRAGLEAFAPESALAFEIDPEYVRLATAELGGRGEVRLVQADFFDQDWAAAIGDLGGPLLVLGNPPWVTNAALGAMGGGNLPVKSNFQGRGGLDAVTGKSNFDISESMLIRLSEALSGREATLAMLCKTSVARKVLAFGWKRAILMYLAEKTGRFWSTQVRQRYQEMQWLMWQMGGLGPMSGQNGHFRVYAPEKVPYAIDRYGREVNRLYGVLDGQLQRTGAHVAGAEYSIADMAILPWIRLHTAYEIALDQFPHLQRWHDMLMQRPAVQAGLAVLQELRTPITEEQRKVLFGQTADSVRASASTQQSHQKQ